MANWLCHPTTSSTDQLQTWYFFFPSNSLFLCMLEFQMLSFIDLLSGPDCFNSLLNPKLDHSDLHFFLNFFFFFSFLHWTFLCFIFVLLALNNCISFLQKFYCIPRNICNIFLLVFFWTKGTLWDILREPKSPGAIQIYVRFLCFKGSVPTSYPQRYKK